MRKTNQILNLLVKNQNEINKSIKELNETLKTQVKDTSKTINIMNGKIYDISNSIENSMFSKEETIKTINREYDYRKEYERYEEKNYELLKFIERYFGHKNKFERLELFEEIERNYEIKRRKINE